MEYRCKIFKSSLAVVFGLVVIAGSHQVFAAGGTWTTKAPMPTARSAFGTGVVNSILYAVGGYDSFNTLDKVEAYDPTTDTWTTKAPWPLSSRYRADLAVGVINGILYAVGGSATLTGFVDAYDR